MKGKKIKVLFDANPMVSGQKSGIGYYVFQLIEALSKNYPEEIELVGHYFNFLGRKNPDLPLSPNISYKSSKLLPGKILSITRRLGFQLPFELFVKTGGDIALFPNYVSLPTLQNIKKVIAIHDLCFEDFPQYIQKPNRNFLKRFVPKSVKSASLVITISESTKLAIQKHYAAKSDSILITPIPPAKLFDGKTARPKNFDLPERFILFVSTLEPRKNYEALARAYSLLPQKIKDAYGLVLAGGYGWEFEESLSQISQLREEGNSITVTGYVDEPTRACLYKNASLFVMPSHYEGFGIPVLEAMSYDLPVAASDIPVFREVAGQAAAYFDKDDPTDIAKTIEKILIDKAFRSSLKTKAQSQLKKYDWDSVAADVMESFRGLTK